MRGAQRTENRTRSEQQKGSVGNRAGRNVPRPEGGAGVTCGARRYSKLTGGKGFRAAAR